MWQNEISPEDRKRLRKARKAALWEQDRFALIWFFLIPMVVLVIMLTWGTSWSFLIPLMTFALVLYWIRGRISRHPRN